MPCRWKKLPMNNAFLLAAYETGRCRRLIVRVVSGLARIVGADGQERARSD